MPEEKEPQIMPEEGATKEQPVEQKFYREIAEELGQAARDILEELSGEEASFTVYSVRGGIRDQDFDIRISGGGVTRWGRKYDFKIETAGASYRLINMKGEQGFENTLVQKATADELKDMLRQKMEPLVEKKEIKHY